jgi:hypothetical protein
MGCLMQTTSLIAQNSVGIRDLGAATGASTFVRNLGGSLGVAILGAIYTSQVTSTLTEAGVSGASVQSTGGLTPAVLQTLPVAAQTVVKQAIADGTHSLFLFAAAVAVAGFVVSWFVKQVPLRDSTRLPEPTAEEKAEQIESTIM